VAQESQEQGAIRDMGRSQAETDRGACLQVIKDEGLNLDRPLSPAAAVRAEAGPEGFGESQRGAIGG
jgi:hypothetical protein